jgi:hypothetical protein
VSRGTVASMGKQSGERRLLLGIRSDAKTREWERLAEGLFAQFSGEGGRLLRASEASLVFDFSPGQLNRLALLLLHHEGRPRLAMALGEGNVALLAVAPTLAHSTSVDVERVERATGAAELGQVLAHESLTRSPDAPWNTVPRTKADGARGGDMLVRSRAHRIQRAQL